MQEQVLGRRQGEAAVRRGVAMYDGKKLTCAAGACAADPSVPDGSPIK